MSDELIIRPIELADFDQVWPIIEGVVQAQETYAFDPQMEFPPTFPSIGS